MIEKLDNKNKMFLNTHKKHQGITLIEALVGVFLLAILSFGIYSSYAFGLKMSVQNRMRTEATTIAEKKIEAILAMDYDTIGVLGGIPPGPIPAIENDTSNGGTYTIQTSIRYIDDPLDDLSPADTTPTDYKQVEVKVNWPTNMENKDVILNTFISPPRMETSVGMGVLIVNTVDTAGNPIAGCHVHITNNSVSPPISVTENTDINGALILPGVPATTNNSYEIVITKDNYEAVSTYPPYPDSTFNPIDAHLAISEGAVTSKVFVMDKLSHLNLLFKDTHGAHIPNLTFSVVGGRVIGTTVAASPEPVYFYNEPALTCNEGGVWNSPPIGTGPYQFSINNASYELISISQLLPWSVPPDSTVSVEILMGNKAEDILVVSVKEVGAEIPIVGATVRITDSLDTLFQESVTDINGIAYFPFVEDPPKTFLSGENYNITITKEGYNDGHDATAVLGITRKEIILTIP